MSLSAALLERTFRNFDKKMRDYFYMFINSQMQSWFCLANMMINFKITLKQGVIVKQSSDPSSVIAVEQSKMINIQF